MDQPLADTLPHPENYRVPDSLMQKLHAVSARFHEARRQLEGAMSDSQYRHQ